MDFFFKLYLLPPYALCSQGIIYRIVGANRCITLNRRRLAQNNNSDCFLIFRFIKIYYYICSGCRITSQFKPYFHSHQLSHSATVPHILLAIDMSYSNAIKIQLEIKTSQTQTKKCFLHYFSLCSIFNFLSSLIWLKLQISIC